MGTIGVNPPKTPVTKGSSGMATATLPNICKMPPPPPPFAPTPLPNIGQSGKQPTNYSTTVTFDGQPVAIRGASFGSTGDIASKATGGGIVSNNAEGPTKFIGPGSLNVCVEGKNVQLLSDQTLNNCGPSGTPANSATLQGIIQDIAVVALGTEKPTTACKDNGTHRWEAKEAKGDEKLKTKIAAANAARRKGTKFEGEAAEHNMKAGDLTRSSQLSGSNSDEKINWVCKVCGLEREGDQLHDGEGEGAAPIAVEVKSKPELTFDDLRQLGRNIQTVQQGGASGIIYKLPAGAKGEFVSIRLKAIGKALGCPIRVVRI